MSEVSSSAAAEVAAPERGRRTGRAGRRGRGSAAGSGSPPRLTQLPRRRVRNPFGPMRVLSDDQVEAIHRASLRILSELGIEIMSSRALEMFAQAGAEIDRASGVVRLDPALVMELVGTAPERFDLTPRDAANAVPIGGDAVAFTLVAGPPNVHDAIRGRRAGSMADYEELVRLAQVFNAIHMIGNQPVAPMELPANTRHLDTYLANLTQTTKSFHCTAIGAGRATDGVEMMAISRGITVEEMAASPGVTTIISVNSPRRFDGDMADGLVAMSERGQAVCITPFTLMGAMSPVTLAGALAQQNAEALFGVALSQIVRPGAPVMYGAFTSNVDMKSGAPAFGTPENAKANIASGQLARRYRLPYRTSPASASNAADAQGAYETMMSLWGAVLGGGNLVYHGAGWQEGGLTASYEKLVMDVEMIQHMTEFLRPIEVSEESLGFEALAGVPTGGHFFGEPHTLARYETAFYAPLLSNWMNHGAWTEAGAKDAFVRATETWQAALREYERPTMEPDRLEALEAYVARRREAIGSGEP